MNQLSSASEPEYGDSGRDESSRQDNYCVITGSDSPTGGNKHFKDKGTRSMSSSPKSARSKGKFSPSSSRGGFTSCSNSAKPDSKNVRKMTPERDPAVENSDEEMFGDYNALGKRFGKTLYYAGRLPTTPRPSFPLTFLAVNAFTSGTLGMEMDTLDFLDLDMASEVGRNACVSPTAVMMALVYLERLYKNNPKYLSTIKPSELFVVALLVASKFEQDDGEQYGVFNSDWVTAVGFDKQQLNQLEIKFLCALEWNVKVDLDEYMATLNKVELALCCQETQRRPWMTYTEITAMSNVFLSWDLLWPILYTYVFQVVTIALIGYMTLITTLLTSAMLTPQVLTLSQTMLSISPAEQHVVLPTQLDLTDQFRNMSKPPACSLSESLRKVLWSIAETETQKPMDYTERRNETNHEYDGIEVILPGFHSAVTQGRGTVIHRHNHLYTIA